MLREKERVRLGTRGSALALAQSHWVGGEIERLNPGFHVEIIVIRTAPDRAPNLPLAEIGDKALWVADLETQLLNGDIDLAVHSMKDLPANLPPELCIVDSPRRECALDALVLPGESQAQNPLGDPAFVEEPSNAAVVRDALDKLLVPGARVGTSSARRSSQLLQWRPDLEIGPVRGNVDTRLRKLDAGEWDAVVLAAAGLRRLGRRDRISALFPSALMLPAAGQGALAIEIRRNDDPIRALVRGLGHGPTAAAITAERTFVEAIEGGCSVPLGAYAQLVPGYLELSVRAVDQRQGTGVLQTEDRIKIPVEPDPFVNLAWAEELGRRTAARFLADGGAAFITQLKAEE